MYFGAPRSEKLTTFQTHRSSDGETRTPTLCERQFCGKLIVPPKSFDETVTVCPSNMATCTYARTPSCGCLNEGKTIATPCAIRVEPIPVDTRTYSRYEYMQRRAHTVAYKNIPNQNLKHRSTCKIGMKMCTVDIAMKMAHSGGMLQPPFSINKALRGLKIKFQHQTMIPVLHFQ